MRLGDTDITRWSTRRRREAGIGYIPEDRSRHGLLLEAPLWENRMLGHQTEPPNAKGAAHRPQGRARPTPSGSSREYDVRTPGIDVLASSLSGGNQQKLIVGREMSGNPTRADRRAPDPRRRRRRPGGDLGPAARTPGRTGLAVLLISADLDELIGLSDTPRGACCAAGSSPSADPRTVTPEQLGSAMTGAGGEAA